MRVALSGVGSVASWPLCEFCSCFASQKGPLARRRAVDSEKARGEREKEAANKWSLSFGCSSALFADSTRRLQLGHFSAAQSRLWRPRWPRRIFAMAAAINVEEKARKKSEREFSRNLWPHVAERQLEALSRPLGEAAGLRNSALAVTMASRDGGLLPRPARLCAPLAPTGKVAGKPAGRLFQPASARSLPLKVGCDNSERRTTTQTTTSTTTTTSSKSALPLLAPLPVPARALCRGIGLLERATDGQSRTLNGSSSRLSRRNWRSLRSCWYCSSG